MHTGNKYTYTYIYVYICTQEIHTHTHTYTCIYAQVQELEQKTEISESGDNISTHDNRQTDRKRNSIGTGALHSKDMLLTDSDSSAAPSHQRVAERYEYTHIHTCIHT